MTERGVANQIQHFLFLKKTCAASPYLMTNKRKKGRAVKAVKVRRTPFSTQRGISLSLMILSAVGQ